MLSVLHVFCSLVRRLQNPTSRPPLHTLLDEAALVGSIQSHHCRTDYETITNVGEMLGNL
jgi:hypothetical protein